MSSPVAACRVPRHAAALTLGLALASLLLSAGCADERQGADPTASKAPPPSVIAVAAEIKPIDK